MEREHSAKASRAALTVAALGVVYGDIGTSPLYAVKETFAPGHGIALELANVLGGLSAIFWVLIVVVSLKYVVLVMRADNRGEGGIMALMALVRRSVPLHSRGGWVLMTLGMFGAALFYGDGMITPAISVLSAGDGLAVAAHLNYDEAAIERFIEDLRQCREPEFLERL